MKTFPGGITGRSGDMLTLTYTAGEIDFKKVDAAQAASKAGHWITWVLRSWIWNRSARS